MARAAGRGGYDKSCKENGLRQELWREWKL